MLEKVKKDLRIVHTMMDGDIQDNINACLLDLERVGVTLIDDTDALIVKAIKLYCRWQYNFENQADRYMQAYSALRDALSLCGDYRSE
jgi:hypothetical protein